MMGSLILWISMLSTPSEPSKSNLFVKVSGVLPKIASYTELVPSRSTNTEKGATDANCEGVRDQHHIGSIFVGLFAILVDGMNSVI